MKKTVLTALVLSALMLSIAGCSNNTGSDSSDSSSSASTTSEATSAPESGAETSGSSAPETSEPETSAPAETGDAQPESGRAAVLGAAALNADEWPDLDMINDAAIIESYFGFNADDAEDYYLAIPMISANMEEIIVVKPKAGSEEAVKTAIFDHITNVTENMFLYPGQEEIAAGAVSGETPDGYIYGIVHKNGADIAQTMLSAE